jgi:hypothetical protein
MGGFVEDAIGIGGGRVLKKAALCFILKNPVHWARFLYSSI